MSIAGLTRVSTASDGHLANKSSFDPQLSADGRYVAFTSQAFNLVSGDNNGQDDVFLKDLITGETFRVSTSAGNVEASGSSFSPSISADGQRIAFASQASNLVPGDSNGRQDVFVKDVKTGALIHASSRSGELSGNSDSNEPALSDTGSHVAFVHGLGEGEVYVRDLDGGGLVRVAQGRLWDLSGEGRYVSFGRYGNGPLVKDTASAIVLSAITNPDGTAPAIYATNPTSLSADGRFVVFSTSYSRLVPDDSGEFEDVFVKDLLTGIITRVSSNADGFQGNGGSYIEDNGGSISNDGRYVVFVSDASNLVPGDTNGVKDLFIKDLSTGATAFIERGGFNATLSRFRHKWDPAISGDGRFIAFQAYGDNFDSTLIGTEASFREDIYVVSNPLFKPLAPVDPDGDPLFDSAHYYAVNADVAAAGMDATAHYASFAGGKAGTPVHTSTATGT